MATIYSNGQGMVVEARDAKGTYYYLADGLGNPTFGGWTSKETAIANLEAGKRYVNVPAGMPYTCDVDIDDEGRRMTDLGDMCDETA